MMRGTFGNIRLRNALAEKEGPFTVHLPDGEPTTIFEASERYRADGVPLIVIAGKEYGSGSSRDWAAKGPRLLGVRAVIAESFERIHRSNLVGMGILPLQFLPGQNAASLGLTGRESYRIELPDGVPDQNRESGSWPGPTMTGAGGAGARAAGAAGSGAPAAGSSAGSRSRSGSTAPSKSTTTARAASCRRSCGDSPGSRPGLTADRGPGPIAGGPAGARAAPGPRAAAGSLDAHPRARAACERVRSRRYTTCADSTAWRPRRNSALREADRHVQTGGVSKRSRPGSTCTSRMHKRAANRGGCGAWGSRHVSADAHGRCRHRPAHRRDSAPADSARPGVRPGPRLPRGQATADACRGPVASVAATGSTPWECGPSGACEAGRSARAGAARRRPRPHSPRRSWTSASPG